MISRRKIRIKALQALYAAEVYDPEKDVDNKEEIKQNYLDSIEMIRDEVNTVMWFIYKVNKYAAIEVEDLDARMLTGAEPAINYQRFLDLDFVKELDANKSFQKRIEKNKALQNVESGTIKNLFRGYMDLPATKEFLKQKDGDEKELLLHFLEEVLLPNEYFQDYMEAEYPIWDDDEHEVMTIVSRIIEKGPAQVDFTSLGIHDITQLGTNLIDSVIQNREYYQELIKPRLKNWDPKRIAKIDMIVLYMGISEFLHFPTIPVNVTINEYIDIIKQFGAKQSKQFVNAILDAIKNQLTEEKRIVKEA